VFYGSFDKEGQEELPPKGEFYCKYRQKWMPEVPGELSRMIKSQLWTTDWSVDVFHKQEIKE